MPLVGINRYTLSFVPLVTHVPSYPYIRISSSSLHLALSHPMHPAPNLPIHGSTQMSITDANGALFTQRLGLGIDRVVVGRELSLGEIASVGHSGVEIEAFVHGALCVSYSGQCFSSEAWGGRSANRGQCAQGMPPLPWSLSIYFEVLLLYLFNIYSLLLFQLPYNPLFFRSFFLPSSPLKLVACHTVSS